MLKYLLYVVEQIYKIKDYTIYKTQADGQMKMYTLRKS